MVLSKIKIYLSKTLKGLKRVFKSKKRVAYELLEKYNYWNAYYLLRYGNNSLDRPTAVGVEINKLDDYKKCEQNSSSD